MPPYQTSLSAAPCYPTRDQPPAVVLPPVPCDGVTPPPHLSVQGRLAGRDYRHGAETAVTIWVKARRKRTKPMVFNPWKQKITEVPSQILINQSFFSLLAARLVAASSQTVARSRFSVLHPKSKIGKSGTAIIHYLLNHDCNPNAVLLHNYQPLSRLIA